MNLVRHYRRLALCAIFVCPALAQESNGIPEFLRQLNQALYQADVQSLAKLFAPEADLRIGDRIVATGPAAIAAALTRRRIWSEQSPPHIANQSVRLVSPDFALVDAVKTRIGSLTLAESTPIFLLLKRTGAGWRIVAFRSQ